MRYSASKRAFSLVEAILYLGLFAIIFTVTVEFGLRVSEGNRIAASRNQIARSLVFVHSHLQQSFVNSDSVSVMQSCEQAPGRLALLDGANTSTYLAQGNGLTYTAQGLTDTLLPPEIALTQFNCELVEDSESQVIGVRVVMTLAAVGFTASSSESITLYLLP